MTTENLTSRLHDTAFATNPHVVWSQLRAHHPVFHDTIDDVWIVSRHADVIDGFSDTSRFSNRLYRKTLGRVFGTTMLEKDGADHIAERKVAGPAFAPTRLDRFRPLIEQVVGALLDRIGDGASFDIVEDISSRLPGTVIVALMGFDEADTDLFHDWYEAMMRGLWNDPELRRAGRAAHAEMNRHVEPIVAARKACPADDLMSRLIERGVDDLPAFTSLLLTAGGETTDKALANLWRNLLADPAQAALVRADHDLVDAAFAETLRHSPSLVYLGREVIADTEWHDVLIPEGAELRLAVGSANRDESVFSRPDEFDLTRDDLHTSLEHRSISYDDGAGHVSFGAGPHFCLGYALSRLEATTATRMMLERFPTLRPVGDVPPITVTGPSQTPERLPVTTAR